ncbi:MAG: 30S ribosomal protein S27ae [Candidatus Woesearchaeota archaeon]|jgi:small subunit ribosomal protein S27Ae
MADKKPVAKGSKVKSKGPARLVSAMYDVSAGTAKRKNKSCPKCGAGVFMAEHKDRVTCGKCGYMEKKK